MYDVLIVGSGFFGSTYAHQATRHGKKCWIVDKNPYLGGMAHDSVMENLLVASHGAHILHTNSDEVWNFLSQFGEIEPFINKPKILTRGKVYSFPINLMTLHQLWGVVTPQEAREKLNSVRMKKKNPRNFEEWALSKVGKEIYELFIYGYTKKQWLREPKDLPSSIIQRLPIRLTYDENYFTAKHQGMPREGYTKLVENMLDGVKVSPGVDFFSLGDWRRYAKHLVYTGPVDQFFDYTYGKLEYNTLKFEHKTFLGDFQGNAVFNHPDLGVNYLRTVEHKHFYQKTPKHYASPDKSVSVVSYDYPVNFLDNPKPYYPIRDSKNSELYARYFELKKNLKNVTFGGRLGEYKYLDIDATVASAIAKEKLL